MSKERITYTSYDAQVWCTDCEWEYYGKNGIGLAAQHCDKYEHIIHCESIHGITFVPKSRKEEYEREKEESHD